MSEEEERLMARFQDLVRQQNRVDELMSAAAPPRNTSSGILLFGSLVVGALTVILLAVADQPADERLYTWLPNALGWAILGVLGLMNLLVDRRWTAWGAHHAGRRQKLGREADEVMREVMRLRDQ